MSIMLQKNISITIINKIESIGRSSAVTLLVSTLVESLKVYYVVCSSGLTIVFSSGLLHFVCKLV